jgi:hypothetical protein
LPGQVFAKNIPWGKLWSSMSKMEREMFIIGYSQGYGQGTLDASMEVTNPYGKLENVPKDIMQRIIKILEFKPFGGYNSDDVIDVVTNFYKDPANRYIETSVMMKNAINKLGGRSAKEIEDDLAHQRKDLSMQREIKELLRKEKGSQK